jgi:SAM-dependent methyltransferase
MNPPASTFEHIACPLCQGAQHRVLFARRDHTHLVSDVQFNIVSCKACGMVFVNPRPTIDGIHLYYPPDFYQVDIAPAELLREKRGTLDARLKLVGDSQPGKVLDVGCQKGEFLYVMKQRGWQPVGVEFSSRPPNVFNLPIYCGELKNAPLEPASFDLITLWAVLEHVHDPLDVLAHVSRLLKPSGRALVLVPNFNSIPARFMRHDDVPRHLLMFTPRTLRRAAHTAGLGIQRFVFGDDVFSGSTRGISNFLWKRLRGEALEDIVAQNREPGRWREFSEFIHGKPSALMRYVDRVDAAVTPFLDRLVNGLGLGFIMTAEMIKTARASDQ